MITQTLNDVVSFFIQTQCNFFELLGWKPLHARMGSSIFTRIKGRRGYETDLDKFANQYGCIRLKKTFFYESNPTLRKRLINKLRSGK